MESEIRRSFKYYRLMFVKHDFAAGLTVFLVALPLCLGIALASGAPVYAGLISGIIGGIVVTVISGSQLSVSGPAAGLTTLVAASIIGLGDYRIFLLTVVIAGVFQVLLGISKLGVIASYFPSSVIKGMLAAIGIILISKQIPVALGYNGPNFWSTGFLELFISSHITENLKEFNSQLTKGAVLISIVSLAVYIFLKQEKFKKFRLIPIPLFIVLIGIAMNYLLMLSGSSFALDSKQLVKIPDNIFAHIQFPDFTKLLSSPRIWKDGLIIGILATLETLLCIEAMDKLDKHNRITPVNRELVAQGTGNIFCGLLGAIPLTAVVVRGAANNDAGGRTKAASFTHGILLLLSVMLIPFVINLIPFASLAVILIMTGYSLTKPRIIRNIFKLGLNQFIPFAVTIGVVLATDLLFGVTVGILFSFYYIIKNHFKEDYEITHSHVNGIDYYNLKLHGNVTFLNKVKIKISLEEVPQYSVLTIDGSDIHFIDFDVLEIISEFKSKAHDRHIELHLVNIEVVETTAERH
ncbi:SulP family inorganic anion transporter [Chryseobacterium koreense]|uniref:SulP family inorganic anion transporter n=1 Tax=Chryseobacterium koreense TaxID=232216 RepID=UPI0026EEDE64|nr:SulP family inorganic anion transporter [Chryseobacterium koreense]